MNFTAYNRLNILCRPITKNVCGCCRLPRFIVVRKESSSRNKHWNIPEVATPFESMTRRLMELQACDASHKQTLLPSKLLRPRRSPQLISPSKNSNYPDFSSPKPHLSRYYCRLSHLIASYSENTPQNDFLRLPPVLVFANVDYGIAVINISKH